MNTSPIEWTAMTWNPITGCPSPKISPGCANCYAERIANTRLRHLYAQTYMPFNESYDDPFARIWFTRIACRNQRKRRSPNASSSAAWAICSMNPFNRSGLKKCGK